MDMVLDHIQKLHLSWLGVMDYEASLLSQIGISSKVREGKALPQILALEHPLVITLGKRSDVLKDILIPVPELRKRQIPIVNTDRGGQATIHNRGQLVLYPIIPLRDWKIGVRQYVDALERATAMFLAESGLEVTRGFEPGLWVNDKKIASFGIRVDRGITLHGVSININNELSDFQMIKSCGAASQVTNLHQELAEWGFEPEQWNFTELANQWLNAFKVELSQGIDLPTEPEAEQFEVRSLGALREEQDPIVVAAEKASQDLELVE
ncbi:MAG: lipoyl(octanoyl) transferase LipB [Oligoflexia bacterium]|nr:lipoyl(octanoyl) transferase LipB [Oligoflexia bacterium]